MGGKVMVFLIIVAMALLASCASYTQETVTNPPILDEPQINRTLPEEKDMPIINVSLPIEPKDIVAQEKKQNLISILDRGFEPTYLSIKAGENVLFNSTDFASGNFHIIIGWKKDEKAVRFQSAKLDFGDSFEQSFSKQGTYTIIDAGIEEEERELFGATIEVK